MAGLLEWSNSIRITLANDPGRQLFQDQLNTHGFIFLDDYLDNIVSGPSEDPLIELVKTPGRRKAASKKPRILGASKLNHILPLEDDGFKENVTPINNFHQALLKAKDQTLGTATNPLQPKPQSFRPSPAIATDEVFSPVSTLAELAPVPSAASLETSTVGLIVSSRLDDLSVIAEDDENSESNPLSSQRSDSETQPPSSAYLQFDEARESGRNASVISVEPTGNLSNAMDATEASSNTLQPIALDSPRHKARELVQPPSLPRPAPSSVEALEAKTSQGNYTAPLLEIPPWNPPETNAEEMTAPLPSASTFGQDINVPLRDHDDAPSSAKGDETKFDVPLFPSLPAPMPLRKSIRAPRDASIGTGPLGAATPGAPPGGKRTSWLKKVREVKALEVNGKHINPLPPVPSASSGTLKRKSGDIVVIPATTGLEDEERRPKSAKSRDDDIAPLKAAAELPRQSSPPPCIEKGPAVQEGMLDRFKRTVEGLGAKVGKSTGKSLGAGAAVSALAEARAAAEARVAERNNKEEEMTRVAAPESNFSSTAAILSVEEVVALTEPVERRFSVPPSETTTDRHSKANHDSTTTTPPDSPPTSQLTSFILSSGPVFNKPPPVFVAPVPAHKPASKDFAHLPPPAAFSIHVGLSPRLPSPLSKHTLSKQSALESLKSDAIFDDTDVPAWVPETQDTEYSSAFGSQSQHPNHEAIDEDDSWPIDEKLAIGVQWTFGANVKEDSMTWSTLPSQSQRADSTSRKEQLVAEESHTSKKTIPGAFTVDVNGDKYMEYLDDNEELDQGDSELEGIVMHGKSTLGARVDNLQGKTARPESQMSMASSQSSQSHTGFLGQASKLLSSALGTSKKGKPEVKKVLQMAAVAAKKQQEENDKKAARLKEMENRRQLAMQRKAEEEKARALEQERKLKEEGERRKREREEHTDKRPLKMAVKKDDDMAKKRKVTVEVEKKDIKKLPSKTASTPSMKQPIALSSSAAYNASLQTEATSSVPNAVNLKPSKPIIPSLKGKGKDVPPKQGTVPEDDLSQPSQLMQIQMAARAKAQLQAAALHPASESIDLPDINSEYSDSDDEDRPKSFPEWAQSPELREALQLQSTINPDDIFGAIRPLRMEELFKTRTSRFRARTSSANWTGADRLTLEEEREYAKRMGFK